MANLSLYVYHVITIYGLSIFFLRFLGLRSPGFTSQELQQKTPKKNIGAPELDAGGTLSHQETYGNLHMCFGCMF